MSGSPPPSRRGTVVICAVGLGLIIGVWVWGGATYDSHGNALINDSMDSVIATGLIAAVTTGAAVLERWAKHVRKDTSAVRDQVANSHLDENGEPILMRDDLDKVISAVEVMQASDARQDERTEKVLHEMHLMAQSLAELKSVPAEIGGIRQNLDRLTAADQQEHADIAQLRRDMSTHDDWSRRLADRITNLEEGKK